MAKKSTLAEMLENQPEKLKEAIRLIDEQYLLDPVSRASLEVVLEDLLKDDRLLKICQVYMDSKYPDSVGEPESERTQEDKLEFGDINDDEGDNADGETEEEDDEFTRLLNSFINRGKRDEVRDDDCKSAEDNSIPQKTRFEQVLDGFVKGGSKTKKAKTTGSKSSESLPEKDSNSSGYDLLCSVDESPAELPVQGVIDEIIPERGQYVHVDLVISDIEEQSDLRVEVSTLRGTEVLNGWFDKVNIPLYRDGNHLHLKPTLITDLFGKDYKLDKDEQDYLVMILYKDADEIYSRKIPIRGPWPSAGKPFEACAKQFKDNQDMGEQMDIINERAGWHNFKARMAEMVSRCDVGKMRKDAGLTANSPRLHTVIIGNPGTGKSSCVPFMAGLYKSLGLLDTDEIWTTRVSKIASSAVNGEYENMLSAIDSAQGGTLVFENAHELYRIEKNNT